MGNGQHVLDAIGNTALVKQRRIVPPGSARIVAKPEAANPTGSMKDRLAPMIVERAAAVRLPPGGTVVEYTASNTGISLAPVASALGYKTHFAFTDAFSDEKPSRCWLSVHDHRCAKRQQEAHLGPASGNDRQGG